MRKILLSLVAILAVSFSVSAQSTRYHGEVYVSGNFGVGNLPLNRFQLHTIQGARFGDLLSVGVGLGADAYAAEDFESWIFMVPVFADIKIYAPTKSKFFDPFVMLDLGYGVPVENPSIGGLMLGAGLGFKAGAFALSVGYHLQQIGSDSIFVNMSALQLKLGVAF
ncbi:MAG: hypothetical protein IKK89_01870 [Alistipes sp.]|nr:hypothetical protein [Alistipes sp.]MBR6630679.1 hypothetical protein [Alistipes sp.]